jgi:Flp pilus assembly protein protease CpaA
MTTSLSIARALVLGSFGIILAWSDLRSRRIPNQGIALFTIASAAVYILKPSEFLVAAVCAILFAILLFPISLLRHKGLGGGDIKLIIALALLLGRGSHILSMLILASLFGLLHLTIEGIRRRSIPRSIAFAPALIGAAFLSL